ncbi:MAG: DUF2306 domain-containing protein [Hyphomicrobiaceae bacterium]
MTLEPLLSAKPVIQVHAFAAMFAFVVGSLQLIRPKGGSWHRALGYAWVAAMLVIAGSSFWINDINQWNGFSLIHLLSIQVIATLPFAVHAARRGDVARHRFGMVSMFIGALVIAGAFTLLPGRIMNDVVLGR